MTLFVKVVDCVADLTDDVADNSFGTAESLTPASQNFAKDCLFQRQTL